MKTLGLILILFNVGAIVGPIAGVVIAYNGNLQEMIAPPEVQQIVSNTIKAMAILPSNPSNPENPGGSSSAPFAMPQYVRSSYDLEARTVTATFNCTNPFNVTLTVNVVSANVRCNAHGYSLGLAAMPKLVEIPPTQTADITVVFAWTQAAQEHMRSQHSGQSTINVDLVNITINVSGISVQVSETYNVDIPLC